MILFNRVLLLHLHHRLKLMLETFYVGPKKLVEEYILIPREGS